MLRGYLVHVTIFFTVVSQSPGQNCIRNFYDAEEKILNGSQFNGILFNISNAFFPAGSAEKNAEYLAIQYMYALSCTDDEESNSSQYQEMDYIWVSSSVYLVVEPNAFNDLTLGIVDVAQGSLSINLQCMCPSYPSNVTDILSRLTAYLRCYAKNHMKPSNDDECKTNSFIRKYDPYDSLYEKVNDVTNTIKVVALMSLILMLFLELEVLKTLYTFVLKRHNQRKLPKNDKNTSKDLSQKKLQKNYKNVSKALSQKKENVDQVQRPERDYLYVTWATFYIALALLVLVLARDIDSNLADCNTNSNHDYKELYIGVYTTWLVGLLVAFYFPKCSDFPVPTLTGLFHILKKKNTKLFKVLTFIAQTLMIWIVFCLVQLLTFHAVFILVAFLAKPVAVLVTLAYTSSFIAMAISGTSVMLEVVSWERINPYRKRSENAEKFKIYNYLKDLPNLISSFILSIFIFALMFLSYELSEKLGSTLNFTGVPAAIAGTVHTIFIFIVSIALREKSFLDLFKEKDYEEKPKDNSLAQSVKVQSVKVQSVKAELVSSWPHKFLYSDNDNDNDDCDYEREEEEEEIEEKYSINKQLMC